MEINIDDHNRILEVWLGNGERHDAALQAQLKPLYAACKAHRYTVAVYLSGQQELYPALLNLLAYNKTRMAELDVLKEKQPSAGICQDAL